MSKADGKTGKQDRKARLAAALRANLRRRKDRERARSASEETDGRKKDRGKPVSRM